jgi:excisionase family DNA binding protein
MEPMALTIGTMHADSVWWEGDEVDRQTLSIMKACELVGVSRRTIYNWIASGKVEYVRTAGGSVRIFADTLWRSPNQPARARVSNEAVVVPPRS